MLFSACTRGWEDEERGGTFSIQLVLRPSSSMQRTATKLMLVFSNSEALRPIYRQIFFINLASPYSIFLGKKSPGNICLLTVPLTFHQHTNQDHTVPVTFKKTIASVTFIRGVSWNPQYINTPTKLK